MKYIYKYSVYVTLYCTTFLLYGQSIQEMQKLKTEYEKYQRDKTSLALPGALAEPLDTRIKKPDTFKITPYKVKATELNVEKSKFFGYDFFTQRDTVSFWESLPTPSNYLLGPGDELIISIWGETQLRKSYIISKEGSVYDEQVGLLSLAGKNLSNTKEYLIAQFSRIFSTLNASNPSTFLDISLGELKSINVNFVGEVKYPGVYPIHPFSTVITGIIQAGGIDTLGSLRKIIIKRDGKDFSNIDLYDFFLNGELPSKIQLRDQDIILIPTRTSYVTIDSAVSRPGVYESTNGESVHKLIEYSGGLTFDASEKIGIRRLKPKSKRTNGIFYEGSYVDYSTTHLIPLNSGDHITAMRIFEEIQQVQLIGQVKAPGYYHYYEGIQLNDLLDLGSGLKDSTFQKSVNLGYAEIIRRNPTDRYDKIITLNLEKYLIGQNKNIILQNLDKVVLHANLNFFEKDNVIIQGEVNIPGSYPLIKDNESLKSFLDRAGGLTPKALKDGISIFRNPKFYDSELSNLVSNVIYNFEDTNLENEKNKVLDDEVKLKLRVAWQNDNISLMPGDSIFVKEKTASILVNGAVYNPGVLEYRKGKSLSFYLNSAGGLTQVGNYKGIIVLYPNGTVKVRRWYSNPKIIEGSTIIVTEKAAERPFDITQFATNWTSIISSMITAVILSKQIDGI